MLDSLFNDNTFCLLPPPLLCFVCVLVHKTATTVVRFSEMKTCFVHVTSFVDRHTLSDLFFQTSSSTSYCVSFIFIIIICCLFFLLWLLHLPVPNSSRATLEVRSCEARGYMHILPPCPSPPLFHFPFPGEEIVGWYINCVSMPPSFVDMRHPLSLVCLLPYVTCKTIGGWEILPSLLLSREVAAQHARQTSEMRLCSKLSNLPYPRPRCRWKFRHVE